MIIFRILDYDNLIKYLEWINKSKYIKVQKSYAL